MRQQLSSRLIRSDDNNLTGIATDAYSPFGRELEEIQPSDLAVLKTVSEGWYIEYKEMFPGQASVAKSISAFANTYGGWLFYGIKESSDGERSAGAFPGIDVQTAATNDQQIRQAATEKINPIPYFVTRVLRGPDPSIGLAPDKAIIMVYVPQGVDAPYLHATGRIYTRVGDASEPTYITDRHTLDLLTARSEKTKSKFTQFVHSRPRFPDNQSSVP
jgi:predicted HTH transcriptional regulator